MNPASALVLAALSGCVSKPVDTGMEAPPDPDSGTSTPTTDSTPPEDSATPGWDCGVDVPEGVRVLGVYELLGEYRRLRRDLRVDSFQTEAEWEEVYAAVAAVTSLIHGDLPFATPDYTVEQGLFATYTQPWGMIPFGLYEITGDPTGATPIQTTWCTVYLDTRLDTGSTTIAVYAVPREWGEVVDATLVSWDE